MVRLRIPPVFEKYFVALAKLSNEDFEWLNALYEENYKLAPDDDFEDLVTKRSKIEHKGEEVAVASNALTAVSALRSGTNKRYNTLLKDLQEALRYGYPKHLDKSEIEVLANRFDAVFTKPVHETWARVQKVSTQYEHVFHSAMILTDVRPVFKEPVTEGICEMVVMHNLTFEYESLSGDVTGMCIALSSKAVSYTHLTLPTNREV